MGGYILNSKPITRVQLGTWLLVAMSAPLASIAGRYAWYWNIGAGIMAAGVCAVVKRFAKKQCSHPVYCAVQWIWTMVVLIAIGRRSRQMWPDAGEGNLIAVALLLLAGWSVWGETSRPASVGATLVWFAGLLYLFLFAAGIKDVEFSQLVTKKETPGWDLLFVYLIPAVLNCGGYEKEAKVGWTAGYILFGATCSILVGGILPDDLIRTTKEPFYEMSKSLSLSGVARRFEALTASAVTIGWFALASLLMNGMAVSAKAIREEAGRKTGWSLAIAASLAILCEITIKEELLVLGAVIFWVLLPLMTQGIVRKKKDVEK